MTEAGLVLITDCDHPDIDTERAIFAAAGLDVRLASCRTEDDVLAAGAGAGVLALLVEYAPTGARVLDGLPSCRVVGRYGTARGLLQRGIPGRTQPTGGRGHRRGPGPARCRDPYHRQPVMIGY